MSDQGWKQIQRRKVFTSYEEHLLQWMMVEHAVIIWQNHYDATDNRRPGVWIVEYKKDKHMLQTMKNLRRVKYAFADKEELQGRYADEVGKCDFQTHFLLSVQSKTGRRFKSVPLNEHQLFGLDGKAGHCQNSAPLTFRSLKSCGRCKVQDTKLSYCPRCKIIKYCSQECQHTDWPDHRQTCDSFAATHGVYEP